MSYSGQKAAAASGQQAEHHGHDCQVLGSGSIRACRFAEAELQNPTNHRGPTQKYIWLGCQEGKCHAMEDSSDKVHQHATPSGSAGAQRVFGRISMQLILWWEIAQNAGGRTWLNTEADDHSG